MEIKEYEHPFFKVVLNYDETRAESDYEKELVKRYLNYLSQQQEKKDLIKALRNRYFHEQFMVDEATPELDKITGQYKLLIKSAEVYKEENKNDRGEFIKLEKQMIEANINYKRYYKETLDKISDAINENEKDFEVLMGWFENDGHASEAYSNFYSYTRELYKNYSQYSLDLARFDKSTDEMRGELKKLKNEWNELFDIREKTVALCIVYTEKINKTNSIVDALQKMVEELLAGKFKPLKAEIEEIDLKCIQFRFLEKELFTSATDINELEFQFRVDHEIEKLSDNLWIFHMDNHIYAHHELYLQFRTSFKIPLSKNDMLSMDMLTSLFDWGFHHAFECADKIYKKEKRKFDWTKFKMPEESKTFLLNNLAERTSAYDDKEEELQGYLKECYIIEGTLVERGTILILNEVLFYNPAFNWEHNQDAFSNIIRLPNYVTLRCIIEKVAPGNPQTINVGRALTLLLCIECASQLLTGDHLPALEPALDKAKFDHSIRKEFLRQAQEFVKDSLDAFKKANSTFVDMEEEYRDWNEIIQ
jgi:hypothetical protein